MARIEHFAIFGNDLDALLAFYRETMGLRVIVDNSQAPVRGYFLADEGGSVLEIIARPEGTPAPASRYGCHTAFWVDDYDATKRSFLANGAKFEPDTEILDDAFKTGFTNDPEGNRVQIVWRARPLGQS